MKKICKKVSFMLSVILILNTVNVVFAATTDIENHWAKEAIQEGLDSGYFYAYDDNSFKPDQPITRAEFLKFLNNAFGLKNKTDIDFKDVSKEDSYYEEVRKTVAAGYMSGKSKDSFDPEGSMTREEMATIIANVVPPIDSVANDYIEQFGDFGEISDWSKRGVETAVFRGYVKGKPGGKFDPKGYLTRAEASTLIKQVLTRETIVKDDIILNDIKELEKLKNSIVVGNVTLSDKIKTSVTIDNCALLGNFVINGGKGIISVKQSIVNNVIVNNKNNVLEIVSSGNTRFNNVTLKTKAVLKTDDPKVTTESIFKNVVEEKPKAPSVPSSSTTGSSDSSSSDSSYEYSYDSNNDTYIPPVNPTPPIDPIPPIDPPPTEVVLSVPTNLIVRDDSTVNGMVYNLAWDTVQNSSGYSIVIKHDNNEDIIEKSGGTVNSMEITNLLLHNIEYVIKIKALGTGIYKDSEYSPEIKYTITTSDTTPEIPVELPIPTGLRAENPTTNVYNIIWDKVQNSIGYEIVIDTNAPILIHNNEITTNDISKYLTVPNKEYTIKVKALGTGKYTDSQYALINYTTPTPPPEPTVELPMPIGLKVDNPTKDVYKFSWGKVLNSTGYEIDINTNTPIIITGSEIITRDISEYLTEPKKEYTIQIKALGIDKYTDSPYAKIVYTTPDDVIIPPSGDVEVPVISSLELEDIISKAIQVGPDDEKFKISLNLKWTHAGADNFIISIKDGSNIKEVTVDGLKREFRLNQYITKRNTNYDVTVSAKKGIKLSNPSTARTYTTNDGCGHDNGFVLLVATQSNIASTQAFAVSTQAQFEHIQQHNGGPYDTKYFIQMNDIDFANKQYNKSIVDDDALFMKYDGQGFKVDNFSIISNETKVGVFNQTYGGGSYIKDFTVGSNVVIQGGTNSKFVGGIIAYSYDGVYRSKNYATVNASSSFTDGGVGGIVGAMYLRVINSNNYGNITNTGTTPTGGLIGYFGGKVNPSINGTNSGTVTGGGPTGKICGSPKTDS